MSQIEQQQQQEYHANLQHPVFITKILLFVCKFPSTLENYASINNAWNSAIFPDAASAVLQKLKVMRVKDYYLRGSKAETAFDFRMLLPCQMFGDFFLNRADLLVRLDFSARSQIFENTKRVGNFFACYLPSLKEVDISGLVALTAIGSNFLCDNDSLERVILPSALPNLSSIGREFIARTNIIEIDLGGMAQSPLQHLPAGFLSFNPSLTKIHNLEKLTYKSDSDGRSFIPEFFLCACPKLGFVVGDDETGVSLADALKAIYPKVTGKIMRHFLAGTGIGPEFDLEFLSKCEQIETNFLSDCKNLVKIKNFHKFNKLSTVQSRFFYGCEKLESIEMVAEKGTTSGEEDQQQNQTNQKQQAMLHVWGDQSFDECRSLKELDFSKIFDVECVSSVVRLSGLGYNLHCPMNFRNCENLKRIKVSKSFLNAQKRIFMKQYRMFSERILEFAKNEENFDEDGFFKIEPLIVNE